MQSFIPFFVLLQICGFGKGQPSECTPCETGHFSSLTNNAHQCNICTDCGNLYRVAVKQCVPAGDAICDDCLPGYTDVMYEGALRREDFACYRSTNHIEPKTETSLPWQNANTTSSPGQPLQSGYNSLLIFGLPAGIALLLVGILVVIYLIWKRCQCRPKRVTPTNSTQNIDYPIEERGPYPKQETELHLLQPGTATEFDVRPGLLT